MDEMKRWKIELRRLLDIIYPGFDRVYDDLYGDFIQAFLLEYSHPEIIRKRRLYNSEVFRKTYMSQGSLLFKTSSDTKRLC